MRNFKKLFSLIFLIVFLDISFSFSFEIKSRIVTDEKGEETGEILIRGTPVIKISEKGNFPSIKKKTETIQERLLSLQIKGFLKPENIVLGIYKNDVVIVVKGYLLITVSEKEAKKRNLTPLELGEIWMNELKKAVLPPTLIIPFKKLEIPLYEERNFLLSGTAKGEVIFNYDKNLLDVQFDSFANKVIVRALATGITTLNITREQVTTSLEVIIKKYAGYILKKGEVYITGDPSPESLIKEVVLREARKCLFLEENSYFYILEEKLNLPPHLEKGEETAIKVPVKIEGKDYFTFNGEIEIKVINEPLPFQDAKCLLISNSPENIKKYGRLIDAWITEETPLRVLYHHRNSLNNSCELVILIANREEKPLKIHIIKGEAGPSKNEIFTGYLSAYKFLNNYFSNTGEIISIPPNSYYVLLNKRMSPSTLLSGIFQIRILEKGKAYFEIKAISSYHTPDISLVDIEEDVFPHFQWTRKGIYSDLVIEKEYSYIVDSKWCFINIGDIPISNGEGRKLLGNYGVLYDIKLKIVNPTPYYKKVKIFFAPAGGVSQGIFLINGKFKTTKVLNHDSEEEIEKFLLNPREEKFIQIKTIPFSGVNYPVRLIVRK
jgi:hypothetical protein